MWISNDDVIGSIGSDLPWKSVSVFDLSRFIIVGVDISLSLCEQGTRGGLDKGGSDGCSCSSATESISFEEYEKERVFDRIEGVGADDGDVVRNI